MVIQLQQVFSAISCVITSCDIAIFSLKCVFVQKSLATCKWQFWIHIACVFRKNLAVVWSEPVYKPNWWVSSPVFVKNNNKAMLLFKSWFENSWTFAVNKAEEFKGLRSHIKLSPFRTDRQPSHWKSLEINFCSHFKVRFGMQVRWGAY